MGGGECTFSCPIVRKLDTLNFIEQDRIKRIRGIAHSVRVSSKMSARMISAARSVLNEYIPDVYLFADDYKGENSGKSPGYGISLVAESATSALHSSEVVSLPGQTPEDVGIEAATSLLAAIVRQGCIDRHHQWLALLFMVLASEDVGRVILGPLSPFSSVSPVTPSIRSVVSLSPASNTSGISRISLASCSKYNRKQSQSTKTRLLRASHRVKSKRHHRTQ